MRWLVVLLVLVGCDQLFGIQSVVPVHDGGMADSGGGPLVFVQNMFAQCVPGLTCSSQLPLASFKSDVLVVTVTYDDYTPHVTAVTDSDGNLYTQILTPRNWPVSSYRTECWYAISTGGTTPLTATATFSSSTASLGTIYIDEYTGTSATTPVDQVAFASGAGSQLATSSGFKTTTSPRELIFGHGEGFGAAIGAGSGFVTRSVAFGNIEEDRLVTTAGAYDASFTANGVDDWIAVMITLQ